MYYLLEIFYDQKVLVDTPLSWQSKETATLLECDNPIRKAESDMQKWPT